MSDLFLFFIFILIMSLSLVGAYFFLNKLAIPKLDKWSSSVSTKLISKTTKYYRVLLISEIIFFLITISFAIFLLIYAQEKPFAFLIITLFYIVISFFLSTFIIDLRGKVDQKKAIKIPKYFKLIKNSYLITRITLLAGKTGLSLYAFVLIVSLLFSGLSIFSDIPYQFGYLIFIFIPIGLAAWVYFVSFDKSSQSLRRILSYILLLFLAIYKSINDFKVLLDLQENEPLNDYLLFLMLTIFTAIDRLFKSVVDDYGDYKKNTQQ
ncbi:hypothetical protein [Niallia taxi]|uniref:hypothetical protein n=1 Tax=Niallia taxi TaxID=2499688 RepID=UPI002E1C530E|nr:hypothetical protein [Niallia taxi]